MLKLWENPMLSIEDRIETAGGEIERLRGLLDKAGSLVDQLRAENEQLKTTLCKYQHIASPEDRKATKLLTEIERLKAELAEAKKDAERYRWIKEREYRLIYRLNEHMTLDESIDAAMKGK